MALYQPLDTLVSKLEPVRSNSQKTSDDESETGNNTGAMFRLRRRLSRSPESVYVCEQRILVSVTGGSVIAVLFWIVAISTDYWFNVDYPGGIVLNKTSVVFLNSHSGLWRICKRVVHNGTKEGEGTTIKSCEYHRLFPSELEIKRDPEVDRTILDYTRTETAFAIISLCLMIMSIFFSCYTFKEPRYMFKRLAGGVNFLSAISILVVIEVLVNSVKYEEQFLSARHPKGAVWSYGVSFVLAWITFALVITTACTFIICSRKRKGDKAVDEYRAREDEPHILGRI